MSVRVSRDASSLADDVAAAIVERLRELFEVQDEIRVCLTGGTIANDVYARLARLLPAAELDVSRLHVWWGDERWVPAADEDRNARQALRLLGSALLGASIHAVPASDATGSAEEAASQYAATLPDHFHLELMGVGPDGHCLSVFPDHPSLEAAQLPAPAVIAVTDAPKPPPTRVSLTFAAASRTDALWVVASGEGKADVVGRALAGDESLPASHPQGRRETVWFLDEDAASRRRRG